MGVIERHEVGGMISLVRLVSTKLCWSINNSVEPGGFMCTGGGSACPSLIFSDSGERTVREGKDLVAWGIEMGSRTDPQTQASAAGGAGAAPGPPE
jgi:hypothetical protein